MSIRTKATVALAAAAACATGVTAINPALADPAAGSSGVSPKATPTPTDGTGNVDIRLGNLSDTGQTARGGAIAALTAKPAVQKLVAKLGPQSLVDMDPLTGTPRQVARLDGLLTGASSAPAKDIALGFVRDNAEAFGLDAADIDGMTLANDYVDVAGTHHLSFTQQADGVPLFGNGLKANVTKDGRLINVTGSPVHKLAAPKATRTMSDADAVATAKKAVGEKVLTQGPRDEAKAVLFQTGAGARRAVQTITMSGARPALSVIDVESGRVLYRQDLRDDLTGETTAPPARFASVHENYPGASGGGAAKVVDLHRNPQWLTSATTLAGNNVHTYTDVDDNGESSPTEEIRPTGERGYIFPLKRFNLPAPYPCKAYVCTWNPSVAYSWKQNASRASVQNFYYINQWHDYLLKAPIGFTEAAGNFQLKNTTGKGKGNDAVIDQSLDGAAFNKGLPDDNHIDNANFAAPPDGYAPLMQMYLFHMPGSTWEQDPETPTMGADAADIVYHEYTHGLSNRLVIDANGVAALDAWQSGSMGEAWSDWYGLDYLVNKGYVKNTPAPGEVIEGAYVTGGPGIRTEPTDCPVGAKSPVCPGMTGTEKGGYTYGDFEVLFNERGVHGAGEIWAQTLWDLRANIGSLRSQSLVTRAMELSPTNPSYLDMRNAIIQADVSLYKSADVGKIWTTFAKRGMGFYAATTSGNDRRPVENFNTPPNTTQRATMTGTITTAGSNGEPVAGAVISFSGHVSGRPGDYTTTTDANGHYSLSGIYPGYYPQVTIVAKGYDPATYGVNLGRGTQVRDFTLVRDWAAISGGAVVTDFNGQDASDVLCGPKEMFDQSQSIGWSSDWVNEPRWLIVKLPAAIDISTFLLDPAPNCGDGFQSMTTRMTLETSPDGKTWTKSAQEDFSQGYAGHMNPIAPAPASAKNVRFVRYTMVWPLSPSSRYVDSTELEVLGVKSAG